MQHKGYEVEGEDGNFVCAFHTPADAVPFAIAIQEALLQVNWSEDLLSTKWCHEQRTANGELSFRGMRLSVGMCTGNALRVQPCVRTGKMEYYGPIMNHAARVATAAHGGQVRETEALPLLRPLLCHHHASSRSQSLTMAEPPGHVHLQVLMHEATWQALLYNITDYAEEGALFSNMGKHSLKGITKQVYITQAIPKQIQSRAFPPIKTLTTKSDARQYTRDAPVPMELDYYLLGVGAIDEKDVEQQPKPSSKRNSDNKGRSLSDRIPEMAADFHTQAAKAVISFKSAFQVSPATQRLRRAMNLSPKSKLGQVATRAFATQGRQSRANMMDRQASVKTSFKSSGIKSLKRAIASGGEINEVASSEIPSARADSALPVSDDCETLLVGGGTLPPPDEHKPPIVEAWGGDS